MTTDSVFALIPNSLSVYFEQVRDLASLLVPAHPFPISAAPDLFASDAAADTLAPGCSNSPARGEHLQT